MDKYTQKLLSNMGKSTDNAKKDDSDKDGKSS